MCTRRPSYNVSTHDYGLWASLIMWLRRKNDVYWVTIEERVLFLDTSHLTHAYLLSRKSILWHMVEIQFFHMLINIPSFLLNGRKKGGGQGMHQAWVEIHGNDHHMRTQMFVTTLHTLTSACMNLNSHDCYVWWWQQREFTVVITFMSPDKDRHILIAWDGDTLRLHLV